MTKNFIAAIALFFAPVVVQAACTRPVYFFDLGQVLINTSDWDHLKYMNEAQEYLHQLKARGERLALITNVPESWGADYDAKLQTLKGVIAKTWIEPTAFEWELFEMILLPLSDAQRKPAPFLFQDAIQKALPCPAFYQGEDLIETQAADREGMQSYQVGRPGESFFQPLSALLSQFVLL